MTVEDALQDYLEARKVRCSAEDLQKDRICIEALIVPSRAGRRSSDLTEEERRRIKHTLRGKLVGELTTADLRRWRYSRVPQTDDREVRRRSQATANKVWSILRVALNLAYQNEKTPSDHAWRRIPSRGSTAHKRGSWEPMSAGDGRPRSPILGSWCVPAF